ncbi:GGDEF domain-containing protein [Vibrio sp. FNV 38]|nr:GGDEF domain-containing protein [Vibrio sp. FNV 38]
MKNISKVVWLMVLFSSAVILCFHLLGDTKTTVIKPSKYAFVATNDQGQGGTSATELTILGDTAVVNCELKKSPDYPWPYCGVSVHLGEDPRYGVDFSHYHTIELNVDLVNLDTGDHPRMRFYLRNYNPAYSNVDDEYTHKYNGLDYYPQEDNDAFDIPLNALQVMSWWLVDNEIPIKYSAPERKNVNKIEFATGSGVKEGRYRLVINNIKFIGDYTSAENVFLFLLLIWISLGIHLSYREIRHSHQALKRVRLRQQHLHTINQSLRAQTFEYAELANRDALTGAMTRHAVRDWLHAKSRQASNKATQLGILYLDIDHFKSINDSFGHGMGDDILREFVMVILREVRPVDRVVRWGGEEFIVFCPNVTAQKAEQIAEKIVQSVKLHKWTHNKVVTCSIGVAQLGVENPETAIARADEALYRAKQKGRDRVVIA